MSARQHARRLAIALVGEEGAGLAALRAIEASGHRVAMVLTSPPDAGTERRPAPIWAHALARGYPLRDASAVKGSAFARTLRDERIDLLLNVHSLHIIADEVLAAPRVGCFNLHPGPLPRYAGLNAPSWAILRGEARHGVTVHRMCAGIDDGPIAYQTTFALTERDTALSVSLRCVDEGLPLLDALVEAAANDPASIPAIPQDRSMREYFGRGAPERGVVPWARSAIEVSRFVRAFCFHPFASPWGDPITTREGRELAIASVSGVGPLASCAPGTVAVADERVRVACGDAWLGVDRVKIDGRRARACEVLEDGDQLGA